MQSAKAVFVGTTSSRSISPIEGMISKANYLPEIGLPLLFDNCGHRVATTSNTEILTETPPQYVALPLVTKASVLRMGSFQGFSWRMK